MVFGERVDALPVVFLMREAGPAATATGRIIHEHNVGGTLQSFSLAHSMTTGPSHPSLLTVPPH
jgi:hypothetical protein